MALALLKILLKNILNNMDFFSKWLLRGAQRQFSDFISNEPHGWLVGALVVGVIVWLGVIGLIVWLTL